MLLESYEIKIYSFIVTANSTAAAKYLQQYLLFLLAKLATARHDIDHELGAEPYQSGRSLKMLVR